MESIDTHFFIAIALSIFTFCFAFLGVQLHPLYNFVGLGFLCASLVYWFKVKKERTPAKRIYLQEE